MQKYCTDLGLWVWRYFSRADFSTFSPLPKQPHVAIVYSAVHLLAVHSWTCSLPPLPSSPEMVMQTGASWVILGHSERRDIFGETDEVHLHIMGGGVVEVWWRCKYVH